MSFIRSRKRPMLALALTVGLLGALWMTRYERTEPAPPHAAADSGFDATHSPRTPAPTAARTTPAATEITKPPTTQSVTHLGLLPPMHEWRPLFTELELGVEGSSLEEHLALARQQLQRQYEPRAAARLADAYAAYARYQLAIESAGPGREASPDEQLSALAEQRALALRMLPPELAEAAVLPRLARREYLLRRDAIFDDAEKSVADKQRALADLDPPAPGAAPLHSSPLADYREQLRLHAERLRSATPSERAALLAELRERTLGLRLERATSATR